MIATSRWNAKVIRKNSPFAREVVRLIGSALLFVIVDTDSGTCRSLPNKELHHGDGMCQPLMSLEGGRLDGVAVGGIGMGAPDKFLAADARVHISGETTVQETVAAINTGPLRGATLATTCGHHGHGLHGHDHGGHGPHGPCSGQP